MTEVSESQKTVATSKVQRYTDLARKEISVGLADDGRPYGYINGDHNRIAHLLKGKWIKKWLRQQAHKQNDILRNEDLNEIIENLFAYASIEDARLSVFLRVGQTKNGLIELDLGTPCYSRIQFDGGVAKVIPGGSQTLFYRPDSMGPLPIPAKKGDWRDLLPFLNMSEDEKPLLIAWITYVLVHPRGMAAYALLIIMGAYGTGKSILATFLRLLVDNNAAGIQLLPRDARDMAISARSQYVLNYDNQRSLTKAQSDDLCTFCTGGSRGYRKLYTDDEEILLQVHTPVVINGIHSFVQEPDLASRCLTLHLLPLVADARQDESSLKQEFEQKLPGIFRGILNLAALTLKAKSTAVVSHPERLMEFCKWLAAMEHVLGKPNGELQKHYSVNLRESQWEILQENVLAVTALEFAKQLPQGTWQGTPTQLLTELNKVVASSVQRRYTDWPQNSISFSKRFKQVTPFLKPQGLDVQFRHGKHRQIDITYTAP